MTLHTETCAYLGLAGGLATAAWLGCFIAKLFALAWALEVRFEPRLIAAAACGAVGLALGPRLVPGLGAIRAGSLLAGWAFALFSLYRPGQIVSKRPLDGWGETVLRRATRAAWLLSLTLVAFHVYVWQRDHGVSLVPLVFAAPALAIRRVAKESHAWAAAGATLLLASGAPPLAFPVVAWLAAAALALRARDFVPQETFTASSAGQGAPESGPYRAGPRPEGDEPAPLHEAVPSVARPRSEQVRLLTGALWSGYVGMWSACAPGAGLTHVLWLDATVLVLVVAGCLFSRARWPLATLAAPFVHLLAERHLVPLPRSTVAWGETIVLFGFVLLGGTLAASFRLRRLIRPAEKS